MAPFLLPHLVLKFWGLGPKTSVAQKAMRTLKECSGCFGPLHRYDCDVLQVGGLFSLLTAPSEGFS